MFGRAFYNNPWFIRDLHNDIHSENKLTTSRFDVIESVLNYSLSKPNSQIKNIFRHMFHLFKGFAVKQNLEKNYIGSNFPKKNKYLKNLLIDTKVNLTFKNT